MKGFESDKKHMKKELRHRFECICNKVLGNVIVGDVRQSYWNSVLEPIWLEVVAASAPKHEWDRLIASLLVKAKPVAQWRAESNRQMVADGGNKLWHNRIEGKGILPPPPGPDLLAGQSFGPASMVRHIDPATYKIED